MKKDLIALALAAALLACLAGCGAKTQEPDNSAQPTPAPATEAPRETAAPVPTPTEEPDPFPEIDVSDDEEETCAHELLVLRVVLESGCQTEGKGEYVCAECEKVVHETVLEPLGHRWQDESSEEGHKKVCTVCREETQSEAHSPDGQGCCAVCGYGCGHELQSDTVAPTCLASGCTEHECSLCGYKYADEYADPEGHTYRAADRKAATCTEEGWIEYRCEDCGEVLTITVPKAKHHLVTDMEVPATCQSEGLTQGRHCDVCGEVLAEQKTIPVSDHVYLDGKCIFCGKEIPENYVVPGGSLELPEIPA